MTRIGLARPRDGVTSDPGVAAPATPVAAGTVHEIGVLLSVHLAVAFAVVLTLRVFGVS